jgi:hypothetical protein
MRMVRKIALAAILATTSVEAQAATYFVKLTGTVTSQFDPGPGPVVDPPPPPSPPAPPVNIAVGDHVVMTAVFSDDRIFDNGSVKAAVMYGLPKSGQQFWNVKLNDLTWKSRDDEFDGLPLSFDPNGVPIDFDANPPLSMPYFELLSGGKIGSPHFLLTPPDTNKIPRLSSDGGDGVILPGQYLFGNTTQTPGFVVTWDLAHGSITTVPEPSVWAMTIVGFGIVGAASRRRSRALKSITA